MEINARVEFAALIVLRTPSTVPMYDRETLQTVVGMWEPC